jgi:hypothetical protein
LLVTLAVRLDLWLAAGPTPSPSPSSKVSENAVTPGVWGFVVTAGIGLVVILLILDMIRRLRRVNYRAQVRERIAAEQAAAAGDGAASRSGSSGSSGAPRSPRAPRGPRAD